MRLRAMRKLPEATINEHLRMHSGSFMLNSTSTGDAIRCEVDAWQLQCVILEECEDAPGTYIMYFYDTDGGFFADTWHESLASAKELADEMFRIKESRWIYEEDY